MGFAQSVLIGIFCIVVVFVVLIALMVIIRIFTAVLKSFEPKNDTNQLNGQQNGQ